MKCPECNSPEVLRSRRQSLFDYVCSIFGMFPYRCAVCLYRFRHFGNTLNAAPEPPEHESKE